MYATAEELPDRWVDWCALTEHDPHQPTEALLNRCQQQVRLTQHDQHLLQQLAGIVPPPQRRAPNWTQALTAADLAALVQYCVEQDALTTTSWQTRVILRRCALLAVLSAPTRLGGAGLTRQELQQLTPAALLHTTDVVIVPHNHTPVTCPRCIGRRWLDLLAAQQRLGRIELRDVARIPARLTAHDHQGLAEFACWHDVANVFPAFDRWGWLTTTHSVHPTTFSNWYQLLQELPTHIPPELPDAVPVIAVTATTDSTAFSRDEEIAIWERADALTARITAILNKYA